jgi:Uma2 family endonuclease
MAWQPARKLFTVAEYHRMIEKGVLKEDDRVELLNGEILEMCPIGPRHAAHVDRLVHILPQKLKGKATLRVQSPIILNDYSEPQLDLALLKPRADFYANGHPMPSDVLVVIEVSDSTVDSDRRSKIPTYALAGIPESWLIDLVEDRIEVHSKPYNGVYQEVRIVQRGQKVISNSFPQLKLRADEILG